jgi:hypothetical protein
MKHFFSVHKPRIQKVRVSEYIFFTKALYKKNRLPLLGNILPLNTLQTLERAKVLLTNPYFFCQKKFCPDFMIKSGQEK